MPSNLALAASPAVDFKPVSLPAGEAIAAKDVVLLGGNGKAYRAKSALGLALLNKAASTPSVKSSKTIPLAANSGAAPSFKVPVQGVLLSTGNVATLTSTAGVTGFPQVAIFDPDGNLLSTAPLFAGFSTAGLAFCKFVAIGTTGFGVFWQHGNAPSPSLINWSVFNNAGVQQSTIALPKPATMPATVASAYGFGRVDAILTASGNLAIIAIDSNGYAWVATYTQAGVAVGSSSTTLFNGGVNEVQLIDYDATNAIVGYRASNTKFVAKFPTAATGSFTVTALGNSTHNATSPSSAVQLPWIVKLANGNIAFVTSEPSGAGLNRVTVVTLAGAAVTSYAWMNNNASCATIQPMPDGSGGFLIANIIATVIGLSWLAADGSSFSSYGGVTAGLNGYNNNQPYPLAISTGDKILLIIQDVSFDSNSTYYTYSNLIVEIASDRSNWGNSPLTNTIVETTGSLSGSALVLTFAQALDGGFQTYSIYNTSTKAYLSFNSYKARATSFFGVALTGAVAGAQVSVATQGTFAGLPADQNFVPAIVSDQRAAAIPGAKMTLIGQSAILSGLV